MRAEEDFLHVLNKERPHDRLGSEFSCVALAAARRESLGIPMIRIRNFGILVEHLTDRPVPCTIGKHDLRQPFIVGFRSRHGFVPPRRLLWSSEEI
jgi:hypothetical protein